MHKLFLKNKQLYFSVLIGVIKYPAIPKNKMQTNFMFKVGTLRRGQSSAGNDAHILASC